MTPSRFVFVIVAATSLTVAVVAPSFGYRAVPTAAFFLLFCALPSAATLVLLRRLFPWEGTADGLLRGAVVFLAIVVLTGMVLGAVGWIAPWTTIAALAIVLGASVWLTRGKRVSAAAVSLPLPALQFAVPAGLLIVIAVYGLIHSPLTAYDSLSYHLFFPGRWLQEQRISIIPTPFSDEAQAYAPGNGGLYFLWLMLPFHGDLLARIGQVPFLPLVGIALYALGRRAGARPPHAAWPAIFCFVSRPMVEQATGADVDLVCWSLFLTALYLGIRAAETDERRDWVLWGVCVGLYVGTKYVALVYAPVLAMLPLFPTGARFEPRVVLRRVLWALPGIAVFGLPWYLRNWMLAGSPIYPASLSVAGLTIARGAFSRAAMLHSVFHTMDVRLFPVMAAHALGTTLLLGWAPLFAVGAWRMARLGLRWPGLLLLLLPAPMTLLYWFGVPDNVDSRFMLPVAMVALLPVAFVFRSPVASPRAGTWNAAVHVACAGVVVWTLVGLNAEIPADLPWFMGGWLSLDGLVPMPSLLPALGTIGLVTAALLGARGTPYRPAVLVGLVAAGSAALATGLSPWCRPASCELLRTTSIFLRPTFYQAWDWVDEHIAGATVAYTGNNVPYPLAGPRLENRVLYVNIDRHRDWRFHDYDHAARLRLNQVPDGALARSSGVLLPIDNRPGERIDAVRPRYPRMRGVRDAWLENLRSFDVDYLFISALSAYEIDFVHHNPEGFPIEDDWARADPERFRLAYANPQVRIYAVDLGKGAS